MGIYSRVSKGRGALTLERKKSGEMYEIKLIPTNAEAIKPMVAPAQPAKFSRNIPAMIFSGTSGIFCWSLFILVVPIPFVVSHV
jgi:hypothetical protein